MLSRTTRKSNNEDGRNSNSQIESINIKEEFLFEYPPSPTEMQLASLTGIQTESPNISETSKRVKAKSAIWNYFTKIGNNRLAECKYCSSRLSYKTSISNLAKHLKSKHTVECQRRIFNRIAKHAQGRKKGSDPVNSGPSSSTFLRADPSSIINGPHDIIDNIVIQNSIPCRSISVPQFENEMDASLDESCSTIQHPTDQRHPTEQQVDKLIMNLFIKDFQSLNIVEGKGFKELIEHAFPLYPLRPEQYFKHRLFEKVTALEQEVQDRIKDAQSVCITVENWKPNPNTSYVTVSAHFIIEFKLKTILIDIISDFDSLERLAEEVYNAIRKKGMDKKVLSVVTNEFDLGEVFMEHYKYEPVECFVAYLNVIIDKSIESNPEIMVMTDNFKVFSKVLTCHRPKFREFVEYWYSIYDMLNCCIKEKDQVPDFERLSHERLKLNKTVDLEWTLCEQFCYVLKPCVEVIEEINTESFVSGSLVNPLTFGLKKSLENLKVLPIIENFWKQLISEVTSYSDTLKEKHILNTAMFLDPRFKLYFDDLNIANSTKDKVINLVTDLIGKEGDKLDELDTPPKKQVSSVWQHYEKTMLEIAPDRSTESRARSEVEKYLAEQVLLVSESVSPLDWWKEREKVYPFLSQVAMLNLNAMATCVPGNRFHSPYQVMLQDRKTMIDEPYVKDLVFLNQNNF